MAMKIGRGFVLPPPLADPPAIGPEQDGLDSSAGQSIRYLEHGSHSELVRWHYHDLYELHLIVASRGRMRIGDYQGRFEPYQLILLAPNLPHNWISDPSAAPVPVRDRIVQFSAAFIQRYLDGLPAFAVVRSLLRQSCYGLVFSPDLGQRLEASFVQLGQAQGLRRLALFFSLLADLSEDGERQLLSHRPFEIGLRAGPAAQQMEHLVRRLRSDYARPLSLRTLAAQLALSESACSRLFQRHTGYRFVDYLNQLRIQRACEYLSHSELPITEVCFAVGYNSVSNFNRRFRALICLTPREYRRCHKTAPA